MAWVTALVGLVGTYAASQDKGSSAQNSQQGLADLQGRIGSDQYQRYQQIFAPREAQLANTVFDQGTTPAAEAARAGAEADQAATVAEQGSLRNARRLGINPSSPAFDALENSNQANRAGLVASAKTYGRRYANDSNFQKQMGVLSLGRGLPATAGSLNASAFGMYGDINAQNQARDAAAGKLYGNAAGSLTDAIKQWNAPKTTNISASQVPLTRNDYTPPQGGLSDALNDEPLRRVA